MGQIRMVKLARLQRVHYRNDLRTVSPSEAVNLWAFMFQFRLGSPLMAIGL